jgi:hypothetical protein
MFIIVAIINGIDEMKGFQASKIKEACSSIGIEPPVYLQTTDKLLEVLEGNRAQNCLLFTNFPPDRTYSKCHVSGKKTKKNDRPKDELDENTYSQSTLFFNNIFTNYSFKAIHFITGASKGLAGDNFLKSLSPRAPVTVTRKSSWIGQGLDYEHNCRLFIVEKINEALVS